MAVAILFAVMLGVAALVLATRAALVPARQRKAAIARAVGATGAARAELELPSARERLLLPLGEKLGQLVLRVSPEGMVDSVQKRLLAAGLVGRLTPVQFLGLKTAGGLIGVLLGAFVGNSVATSLIFALALGGAWFLAPDRLLAGRIRKRKDSIIVDLPDALDLLAVSVEAGLSFDGALAVVTDGSEGPLSDEFALTLAELRIGEVRAEALRKLGERTDLEEMKNLARAIIQSDHLGISLARILRLQADDARSRRQFAAEERANKLPVKMIFPTAIFIFPALFIVVVGPAFIQILHTL